MGTSSKGGGRGRRAAKQERHISVRSVRRNPADYRKVARALLALAAAEAAAEGQDQAAPTEPDGQPPKEAA